MEKRKSERLRLPIKVEYAYPCQAKWIKPVSVVDISGYGLNIETVEEININAQLDIKINFPEENMEPIIVRSKVIWCVKAGAGCHIGIKFGKMNYEDRKRYIEYLSEKILLKYL